MGALASRSGDSVGVAMMDVDHFKRFNDTWGHLAGDRALQTVAKTLQNSFRTTDLIARYGGEEFSGLFPGLSMEDARKRLDKIRQKIESTPIAVGNGQTTRVTLSMGLAVWPEDGINLSETLAIADLRLYQAKQGGRNRVVGGANRGVRSEEELEIVSDGMGGREASEHPGATIR
jgi:diguanylate cyclase (GGDEF)-like protein